MSSCPVAGYGWVDGGLAVLRVVVWFFCFSSLVGMAWEGVVVSAVKCHLRNGVGPEYVPCTATVRPCRYGAEAHVGFESRRAMVQYNVLVDAAREAGVDPAGLLVVRSSASTSDPLTPAGFRVMSDEDFQRNVEDIIAIGLSDAPWSGRVNTRDRRSGERFPARPLVDFSRPVEALSSVGARLEERRTRAIIAAAGVDAGMDGMPAEIIEEDALDVLRSKAGMRPNTFDRMLGPKRSPEQLEAAGLNRICSSPLMRRAVALEVVRGSGALLPDAEVRVPWGSVDSAKLVDVMRRGSEGWMSSVGVPTLDRFVKDYPEYADDWGEVSGYARAGEWGAALDTMDDLMMDAPLLEAGASPLGDADRAFVGGLYTHLSILASVSRPNLENTSRFEGAVNSVLPEYRGFLTRDQMVLSLTKSYGDEPGGVMSRVMCVMNPDGTVDDPEHAARRILTYGYRRLCRNEHPSPRYVHEDIDLLDIGLFQADGMNRQYGAGNKEAYAPALHALYAIQRNDPGLLHKE